MFILLLLVPGVHAATQSPTYRQQIGDGILDAVVTVLIDADGQAQPVGSGLVVRGDGLILTAYHLVKGARGVQIRLRNGETFDRSELVASDERRNIAVLRIPATGLYSLSGAATEESWVGASVSVVSNLTTGTEDVPSGILSAVSLADEIPGAGQGYRVLKFTAPVTPNAVGGVLVDEKGRALGLLTALPQAQNRNYAVPLSSVLGLVRAIGVQLAPATALANTTTAPYPIPQGQVSVPQRPVSPLEARGPGSVVVKPSRPVDVLLAAKTIYVTSRTTFFKPDQLINELKKKAELDAWGLSFVDDAQVADLILSIDHVVFTWKFTFTLTHQRTGVVVATGSRIIWDGNLGAPYMADRVIEKLTQVRAQTPTPPAAPNDKKATK
ncbi:MAG: S1C family serine protease [Pyrinomonadaceae bacterium]